MNIHIPYNAPEIYVTWRRGEYGLGVTARTDAAAQPYIGIYPLDGDGLPIGLPIYVRRSRFITDVAVGPMCEKPMAISIDAEVSARGLSLTLCLPCALAQPGTYTRHFAARWGDPRPRFGSLVFDLKASLIFLAAPPSA